jgi:hypothetical protein
MQVYVKAWFSLVSFSLKLHSVKTVQVLFKYSVSSMEIHSGVVTGTDLQMLFSDQCSIQLSYFAARYSI